MNSQPIFTTPVHGHEVNALNESLFIDADAPGAGNASHVYAIHDGKPDGMRYGTVSFQNGPISEAGVNGVSNEALLAIVRHRLQGFQSGPYSCRENAIALTHVEDAMHWLLHRTRERTARGVEGTSNL
jgi:hypothetical protein